MSRACYFYPFTTQCPNRQARARLVTGRDVVSEHKLVREAKTAWSIDDEFGVLYGKHSQPCHFSLGADSGLNSVSEWDDSDPAAMRAHIKLFNYAGIDRVIFNVYGGLREGEQNKQIFGHELCTPPQVFADEVERSNNSEKMQFACNICLSSPRVQLPIPEPHLQSTIPEFRKDYSISSESISRFFRFLSEKFAVRKSYWHYEGRPVFFLYDAIKLTRIDPTFTTTHLANTLKLVRQTVKDVTGENPYIVGLVFQFEDALVAQDLGFDALSSYIFLPQFDLASANPVQRYSELLKIAQCFWLKVAQLPRIPFYPSCVPGWDAWPRVEQGWHVRTVKGGYPATPIVVGSSPSLFFTMASEAEQIILNQCDKFHTNGPLLRTLVACWNEMSEGCSVLPRFDPQTLSHDYSYLDILKKLTKREACQIKTMQYQYQAQQGR